MSIFRTLLALAISLTASIASAQISAVITDISPDNSSLHASDADGASGGRVNGLAVDRATAQRLYAASEWGGLWRSNDNGLTWFHLDGHVPTATWDVEVDPTNSNRVYATSFHDGRVNSRAGINVSTDAGTTWTHPASATPPVNFCLTESRRTEPTAFGIAIDPANSNRVLIGTNCGLAMSTDAGVTWTFIDPTPGDRADNIWDVVVHDGGIIDLCGDDGHQRSINNGTTWTTAGASPLQQGRCSIAVSPDEAYVLYAVVGTSIFESDDGGQSWPNTYVNPTPQGRIPFVATNQRAGNTYDLWFGDVGLFRGTCTTPAAPAPGGAARCNASPAWAGSFTRAAGGHDDTADIAFAPNIATDACPIIFSSDGGVYVNTVAASPGCHTPAWNQPNVTPHALWNFTFTGVAAPGAATEHLYFGNQDNGSFGATNGGSTPVTWNNERCCDGFDTAGEVTRGISTICCFFPGRATRFFISGPGLTGASPELNPYPGGNMRSFEHLNSILNFGTDDYIAATTTGVFVTLNMGAAPVWTQLGAATSPISPCGVSVAFTGGVPTFFVKSGGCSGDTPGTLFSHQGSGAAGTWSQVPNPPAGSFGVYAVDRNNPQRIIASNLGAAGGPRMVMTLDGGTTWAGLPALDAQMTGSGTFQYQTTRGPSVFTGVSGYPQPTLVAFDPADPDIVVAGAADSGVFLSTNGGTQWQLVTDPISPGTSGVPHIPRPFYAHFDHDPPGDDINLYLGTRGRGAWRLTFKKVEMPQIQVPSAPDFREACVGETVRAPMLVCNTAPGDLIVSAITSSNPQFSVVPPSGGFPITVSHDFCFPVQVAFTPTSPGPKTADLVITSNDPTFPSLTVTANANVGQPTAVTMIADTGNFGELCVNPGAFKDLDLTINNSGSCPLLVTSITSSSPAEFEAPQVLTFPIKVAPGDSVAVPIRFHPTSPGPKAAAITIASNDPVTPNKVVNVTGTAPPEFVCETPIFAAIDTAIGPTWGTGRTGNYTYNAAGKVLAPFGAQKTFGVQAQGEYMFYPGRQEGQFDTGLLYRRGLLQFGASGSFKRANLRAEAESGALSHATLSLDFLLPNIRFGAFGAKGLRETDVVTLTETVGLPGAIIANERVLHTIDQLGGAAQIEVVPNIWLDGHIEWLHRHAPGVGDSAGGAIRLSALVFSNIAVTAQFDVNESFLGANTVGTFTFGVTLGRWSRPTDYANPVNPLGTMIPRVHYEVFDRVRP